MSVDMGRFRGRGLQGVCVDMGRFRSIRGQRRSVWIWAGLGAVGCTGEV